MEKQTVMKRMKRRRRMRMRRSEWENPSQPRPSLPARQISPTSGSHKLLRPQSQVSTALFDLWFAKLAKKQGFLKETKQMGFFLVLGFFICQILALSRIIVSNCYPRHESYFILKYYPLMPVFKVLELGSSESYNYLYVDRTELCKGKSPIC
jgi:hypothetical protein